MTGCGEKLLSHNEDYIYYKTDHHWTSEGAYLAYETWCDSTGMESTPLADLKKQVATKKIPWKPVFQNTGCGFGI